MSVIFSFKIIAEVIIITLLLVGYINEEKIIEFERELYKVLKQHIKREIRKRKGV